MLSTPGDFNEKHHIGKGDRGHNNTLVAILNNWCMLIPHTSRKGRHPLKACSISTTGKPWLGNVWQKRWGGYQYLIFVMSNAIYRERWSRTVVARIILWWPYSIVNGRRAFYWGVVDFYSKIENILTNSFSCIKM